MRKRNEKEKTLEKKRKKYDSENEEVESIPKRARIKPNQTGHFVDVVLIGFGNVGQKLASLLTIEKDNFSQLNHTGLHSRIRVIGITTGTKGSLYNKNGIDLVQALKEIKTEGQFLKKKGNTSYSNINSIQALTEWSYDAAIELSPLNIEKKRRTCYYSSHYRFI